MINIIDYQVTKQFDNMKDINQNNEVVLFCAGNPKIWYDSFGPWFADEFRKYCCRVFVYGGVNFAIVPDNLNTFVDFVNLKHPKATVIVVDSRYAINKTEHMCLTIQKRSSHIAGLSNNLAFGDYSILLSCYPKSNFAKTKFIQTIIIKKIAQKLQNYLSNMQKNCKLLANNTK